MGEADVVACVAAFVLPFLAAVGFALAHAAIDQPTPNVAFTRGSLVFTMAVSGLGIALGLVAAVRRCGPAAFGLLLAPFPAALLGTALTTYSVGGVCGFLWCSGGSQAYTGTAVVVGTIVVLGGVGIVAFAKGARPRYSTGVVSGAALAILPGFAASAWFLLSRLGPEAARAAASNQVHHVPGLGAVALVVALFVGGAVARRGRKSDLS